MRLVPRTRQAVVLASCLAWIGPRPYAQATVAIELRDRPDPGGGPGSFEVTYDVVGLSAEKGALGFLSTGWGWPDDLPYLELVASDPPVREVAPNGSSVTLERPEDWDGAARWVYRLRVLQRGSEEQARHGLVPSRGGGFAYANSLNVLLRPTQAGAFLEAEVAIEVVAAAEDAGIVTGWAGRAAGRQRVSPEVPWGNSPVVFGEPAHDASVGDGFEVEAFQFGGPDATATVAELVARFLPAMESAVGWPARRPSRVFLSEAMPGGMGSEYGLHLNLPEDASPDHVDSRWFRTTIAHELFHEWLGVRLHESEGSLVWFREGFTEYFAQWFSVAQGVIGPGEFAETLDDYDRFARSSTSLGHVAFADPGVIWRDGDGPNELMAYRGAPVLALALDVDLRANGHPGLLQLVRDFLAADEHVFPPEALHAWCLANDLEACWNRSIAGRDVPRAAFSLERAGFERGDAPVDVAYLGLETHELPPNWRVTGVDPEGPAARAGVRVGDVISGFFPFTGTPTRLADVETRYTFGLATFAPGIEGSYLGIERDGESLQLFVEPELRPWGLRTTWRATDATESFFSFVPR